MKTRLTVRLPAVLHERLASIAGRLGVRRSDVVRMAVQKYLDEEGRAAGPRP